MLGKKTLDIVAVNRSPAIKAPLGANRCQAPEISEAHFADKRNITYEATVRSRTISETPRHKGAVISGVPLWWPVAGASPSSADMFPYYKPVVENCPKPLGIVPEK